MRFATIAASAAALVAVPFAFSASAPEMSGEEFLQAVRCTAYEDAAGLDTPALAEARYQLNSEARRQPAETAARAEAEVGAARQAVISESEPSQAMMAGCSGGQAVAERDARGAA
ncbi:MAG: hypothetical protein AB7O98_19350 [Hyphomonadaceae bacterium]